jgi:hypothetical protein
MVIVGLIGTMAISLFYVAIRYLPENLARGEA